MPDSTTGHRPASSSGGGVSEADRIAAAQSYIDALVTHDADAVPFAPDCTRIEIGLKTGFSGNHLRRSLNRGPQYRLIVATTPPKYTVVGDEVHAGYDVLTKVAFGGGRVASRVDETFVIGEEDGLIRHIRARVRPFIQR